MKTIGSFWTPAQFIASWKSPRDLAPSPKKLSATRRSPRSLKAIASPRDHHHVGQHRDHRDDAAAPVAEVHVAFAAAVECVRAAQVVPEDLRQIGAANE